MSETLTTGWKELLDRDDVLILSINASSYGKSAQALEGALVDTKGVSLFSAFIAPTKGLRIEANGGLSRAFLKKQNALPWEDVREDIVSHLRRASLVIGWDTPFTKKVLEQTFDKQGGAELFKEKIAFNWRDILIEYRALRPNHNCKLTASARREKVKVPRRYGKRAEHQCNLVLEVMRKMKEEATLPSIKNGFARIVKASGGDESIFDIMQDMHETFSVIDVVMEDILDFDIVGESHYQSGLLKLQQRYEKQAITAYLRPEPDNPHDANAIAVAIDGQTVGHVDRKNAQRLQKRLGRKSYPVTALIRGKYPYIGVTLGMQHGDTQKEFFDRISFNNSNTQYVASPNSTYSASIATVKKAAKPSLLKRALNLFR